MTDVLSPEITALQAAPAELNDQKLVGSRTVTSKGTAEWTGTALDTLVLARVPVDATLDSILLAHDDMATTSITVDVGFYQVGGPGVVVDIDAIATDIDWDGAAVMTETRYEVLAIETIDDKMWDLAGLSARPVYPELDIVVTSAAAVAPLAGTVSWYITYTI